MGGIAHQRLPALLALVLPVLAGIGWMIAQAAPARYATVNAFALAVGASWVLFGRVPHDLRASRVLGVGLLVLLALPLVVGPDVAGVRRWLPAGPLALHAGMLATPALCVLAFRAGTPGWTFAGAALLIALLQPDAATALALAGAAGAACLGERKLGLAALAAVAIVVAIIAAPAGDLPPQRFVERVVADALAQAWPVGLLLVAALVAAIVLLAMLAPFERATRLALAGALAGFAFAAMIGHYPTPLIGYGAAPILGMALALGLSPRRARA